MEAEAAAEAESPSKTYQSGKVHKADLTNTPIVVENQRK